MAIHHTRLKKAMSLIGEEKEVPKIIQLLSQAEFKDDEIQEILQNAALQANGPAKADETPITKLADAILADPSLIGKEAPAKTSKYADFDVFMALAKTKQYRHISGELKTTITHFELQKKEKSVRIEPQLAKDFNKHAISFIDTPGHMYFPAGTKAPGDTILYNDPTYKPMNETTVTNEFMD